MWDQYTLLLVSGSTSHMAHARVKYFEELRKIRLLRKHCSIVLKTRTE